MSLLSLIWRSLASDRPLFLIGIALTLVEGLLAAVPALAVAHIVAELTGAGLQVLDAIWIAALLAVAVALRLLLSIWVRGTAFPLGVRAGTRLRLDLMKQLLRLPAQVRERWSPARVGLLLSDDAHWVGEAGRMTLFMLVAGVGAGCLLLAYAVLRAPAVGVVVIAGLALGLLAFALGDSHVRAVVSRRSRAVTKAAAKVGEYAEGMAVFRTFGRAGAAQAHVATAIDQLRHEGRRSLVPFAVSLQIGRIVIDVSIMIALAVALLMLDSGAAPDPAPMAGIAAAMMTAFVATELFVGALAGQLVRFRLASKAGDEIQRFLREPVEEETTRTRSSDRFDVNFERVGFSYPGSAVAALSDVSFAAPQGSVTALVGSSGAGKSTLLSLLAGHDRPTSGRIRFGGVDVAEIAPAFRRAVISEVGQDVFLSSGSLRDNLLLGDPAADGPALERVIKQAQLEDLVAALPRGLDTELGDRGRTLSGGERQRIAIARALLKNGPILLLDEAASAIDPATERRLQLGVTALEEGRTVFVVAHRLRSVAAADLILVVDRGRIVESGRHGELLNRNGRYAALWREQERIESWSLRAAEPIPSGEAAVDPDHA